MCKSRAGNLEMLETNILSSSEPAETLSGEGGRT